MKKLITISFLYCLLSLSLLTLAAYSPTNVTNQSQQPTETTQETLTLHLISDQGLHFESSTTSSGAFITHSDALNWNLSNVKEGQQLTFTFNVDGEIVTIDQYSYK